MMDKLRSSKWTILGLYKITGFSSCLCQISYQLSSHLLSLTAGRQVVESNVLELFYRQPKNLLGVFKPDMKGSWAKK